MSSERTYRHGNMFIASFQTEGLCTALRLTISIGAKPGPTTVKLLKILRDFVVENGGGLTVEHLPEVTDNMDPQDVFATAEILRTTILAFLSPEEVEEQRGVFGFHANQQSL